MQKTVIGLKYLFCKISVQTFGSDGTVLSHKKYRDGTVPSRKKYRDGTVLSDKK